MQRKRDDLEARQHEENGCDMFRKQKCGCARAEADALPFGFAGLDIVGAIEDST